MSYQLTSANSYSYPNDFDNSFWIKGNIAVSSANATIAPDGSLTADLITELHASSGSHVLYKAGGCVIDAVGDIIAQECYYKDFSGDRSITVTFGNATLFPVYPACRFYPASGGTLSNISAGSSAFVLDAGNGWFKVTLISPPAISTGYTSSAIGYIVESGFSSYIGNSNSGIYAWGADIRKVVDIDPDYDLKDEGKKIETVHRTRSGGQYRYKWGQFDRLKFKIEDLTSSQACTINSWWSENHPVRLFDLNNACVISGYITNATKPIDQYMKPYTDQFKGVIELEGY